jgi:glycosyltransferase involved in cell wall biosynthesis
MPPRLSVTIITKNEERNLPRALASVAEVAGEIVVTDTGSTDRTIEIARQFGARVAHFEWIDDFSAAHNYCNSLATGAWLLMLDADEELLPESHDELRRAIAEPRAMAYHVLRQDLSDETRTDLFTEMWQMRLFRKLPELQFAGRFHHHFAGPLDKIAQARQLEVRSSGIRLRHYGFVASLRTTKNERAARLLELELADRPGQFYYLVELAVTLLSMGDERGLARLTEAAEMVVDGQAQALDARGPLAILLEHVLACDKLPHDFPLSRKQARAIALKQFPTAIPLLWQIATEEYRHARFEPCARYLERILALGASGTYDRAVSFNPVIMGDDARLNLGVCLVRLGRVKEAGDCFRKLLDSPTRGCEAAENLKAIARLRRR